MERESEEKTIPKFSNDPKSPEPEGQETAPNRGTKHADSKAKKHASKSGSSRIAKDANKEEEVTKGANHKRKSRAARQRGASKNRETAADYRGGRDAAVAAGASTTKHKMVPDAARAGVAPDTTGSPDEEASTALGTSDHGIGAPRTDRDRMPASPGRDETKVPSGVADANTLVTSVPAKFTTDNTRVAFSSDTQGAAVAGSSSGTGVTAVPTQQATSTTSENNPAKRVVGGMIRPKRGAQSEGLVEQGEEVLAAQRKSQRLPWVARESSAKDVAKPTESRSLSPAVAKRTPFQYYAVVLFGSLALLTLVAYLLFRTGPKKLHYDTCKTLACAQFAKRLVDSINRSASPCDSFDHYVCDGWRAAHGLSVHEDTFQSVLGRLYSLFRDLDVPKRGQNDLERAAAFYRSCECVDKGKCDELPIVRKLLADAGVMWPRRAPEKIDALKTLLYTSVRLRWGAILTFEFSAVAGERRVFLRVAEDFNLLKWKSDEHRVSAGSRKRYFDVLRDVFGGSSAKTTNGSDVFVTYEDTQDLESKVLQPFFHLSPAKVTETIADNVMYNTVSVLTRKRWSSALALYLSLLKASGPIVFRTDAGSVVLQLLAQWRDHGERAVHLLLSWCAVQLAALFTNQQLIDNFYGSRAKAGIAHGVFCFSKAFRIVGEQVLYGSSEAFLPARLLSTAAHMTAAVRQAFRGRLERWKHYNASVAVVQDWNSTAVVLKYFDEAAQDSSNQSAQAGGQKPRRAAKIDMGDSLAKNWAVAAIASLVDPVSLRLSEDIESLDLYTRIQSGAQSPDFSLLPYAFAFPYFDEGATLALNYAGVGSHMAEALSLLFLDAYDTQVDSAAALTDYFVCMDGNASDTLGRRGWARRTEAVSLKVALDAYHLAGGAGTGDLRLDGLQYLTPEQLFFTAACFTRCAGSSPVSARRGDAQCDSAFRHVEEFAAAFGCPEESPLNPAKRCRLL
ncbi:hypothetical protein HPB52_002432 [Rhipicephalus sanguineus]|uniref:Uncharacterized protein n=1 Tax=Rhipicephalus sanguineus TaxID=34632 RepID=A0A9D4P9Z9_RHISA|nr:hypothetical protein HPB52_002432 [Rhipicephalus sanguineus]